MRTPVGDVVITAPGASQVLIREAEDDLVASLGIQGGISFAETRTSDITVTATVLPSDG